MNRKILLLSAALLLALVVTVGLLQASNDSSSPDSQQTERKTDQSKPLTPELKALKREANRLLPGGKKAFDTRLKELEGTPIVVNKWASWCPPCREEFPFFQSQAKQLEGSVAFIGINSGDTAPDAEAFLKEFPLTFPSFEDADESIASAIGAGSNFPVTVFYSSDGKQSFIHQGGYASESALAEEIDRYAR